MPGPKLMLERASWAFILSAFPLAGFRWVGAFLVTRLEFSKLEQTEVREVGCGGGKD